MSRKTLLPCKNAAFMSMEPHCQTSVAQREITIRRESLAQVGDSLTTVSWSGSSKPRATNRAFRCPFGFSVRTQRPEIKDWPLSGTTSYTSFSFQFSYSRAISSKKVLFPRAVIKQESFSGCHEVTCSEKSKLAHVPAIDSG